MTISNHSELVKLNRQFRSPDLVLSAMESALNYVEPTLLVSESVKLNGSELLIRDIHSIRKKLDINDFDSIYLVGAGKASAKMAWAMGMILKEKLEIGMITVPYGSQDLPKGILVTEASHPEPDNAGIKGTRRIVDLLTNAKKNALVFALISGGGSALMPLPSEGISLEVKRKAIQFLMHRGASIHEVNTVRKHLSAVKGGQLVKYMPRDCTLISLILSDVTGDDLDVIASGPTVPDPSTFQDAANILKKYHIMRENEIRSASRHISMGASGILRDTPKPGDSVFDKVHNVLIGNNYVACKGAINFLRRKKIRTAYLGSRFDCRATQMGKMLARLAFDLTKGDASIAIVMGGETTVRLSSGMQKRRLGIGGRNLEVALSCAAHMPVPEKHIEVSIATMGTDGIDGNSDAAGAIVTPNTLLYLKKANMNIRKFILRHDSYHALQKAKSLIFLGQTGTNVNDIAIICCLPRKNVANLVQRNK